MALPQDTRTRALDVARRLFTQHGYDRTSLREIAEALGVTKAALYYHFRSKEELLVTLVDPFLDGIDGLLARTQARVSRRTGASTTRERRALLEAYFDE